MMNKLSANKGGYILDVIITQEKIEGKTYFVAQGIQIDVASQGLSLEEAIDNIKDAADIVLKSSNEEKNKIEVTEEQAAPMLTRVVL